MKINLIIFPIFSKVLPIFENLFSRCGFFLGGFFIPRIIIPQFSREFVSVGVRQHAQVGHQGLFGYTPFGFPENPFSGPGSEQAMMGKLDIVQKIDALSVFFKSYLSRVQIQFQFFPQKVSKRLHQALQLFPVWIDYQKIVRVPNIKRDLQFFFNKLVKVVQINIGKKLAGQIADRHAGLKTVQDVVQKLQHSLITYSLRDDFEKNFVIYGGKKLPHVAFQGPDCFRVVVARFAQYPLQSLHAPMISFVQAAREGILYEGGFKNGSEYFNRGVVDYPISHFGLVNMSPFRVLYPESFVGRVFIAAAFKFAMESKNKFFQFKFKFLNVRFLSLAWTKLRPGREKIFRRNNLLKNVAEFFHLKNQ